MSSFAVNGRVDVMWHAGYQRFAVLLGDFNDPNLLDCLSQVFSACLYANLSFITVHRFSIGLRSGLLQSHYCMEILFFFRNSVAAFDHLYEDHAAVDMHVQFQFLFWHFHMIGSILRGGMTYRPAAPQHDMAPQTIWFSRCFIMATTYFLSKCLPSGT